MRNDLYINTHFFLSVNVSHVEGPYPYLTMSDGTATEWYVEI
jgi:hypothetical protein